MLVFVEVRTARDGRFGAPEERVDLGKLRSMYRAASALVRDGVLPDGRSVPRGPWRIDLVIVDDRHGDERGDEDRIRHLRAVA
jgi:Holliday junction resolvase-like predicted endonuclease